MFKNNKKCYQDKLHCPTCNLELSFDYMGYKCPRCNSLVIKNCLDCKKDCK